jgi:hypothetical protein
MNRLLRRTFRLKKQKLNASCRLILFGLDGTYYAVVAAGTGALLRLPLALSAVPAPCTDCSYYFQSSRNNLSTVNLTDWDTSGVINMAYMFIGATTFNQPLASWNVSAVTAMSYMFYYASSFNQSLATWDVRLVKYLNNMFNSATAFNQPLGTWNVSAVTLTTFMFCNSSPIDMSLFSWFVSRIPTLQKPLSFQNYSGRFQLITHVPQNARI